MCIMEGSSNVYHGGELQCACIMRGASMCIKEGSSNVYHGGELQCVSWRGAPMCIMEGSSNVCHGGELQCVSWSGAPMCVMEESSMEGSSNVYHGGELQCVSWRGAPMCIMEESSNGVLFLLQNFNITMAVGQGPSYWNKAMKKLCMFVSLCMGVWYIQPRLIWFLDRFLGLRTCKMVSGHENGFWTCRMVSGHVEGSLGDRIVYAFSGCRGRGSKPILCISTQRRMRFKPLPLVFYHFGPPPPPVPIKPTGFNLAVYLRASKLR